MKRLAIEFAPRQSPPLQSGWLAGAGMLVLAVAGLFAASLPSAPVEASHMDSVPVRPLPDPQAIRAVDAAVRTLNRQWIELFDGLSGHFGPEASAILLQLASDTARQVIRLTGAARDAASVQALPARLRGLPVLADAALIGQESQDGTPGYPMHFVIELRLREER